MPTQQAGLALVPGKQTTLVSGPGCAAGDQFRLALPGERTVLCTPREQKREQRSRRSPTSGAGQQSGEGGMQLRMVAGHSRLAPIRHNLSCAL